MELAELHRRSLRDHLAKFGGSDDRESRRCSVEWLGSRRKLGIVDVIGVDNLGEDGLDNPL